MKEYYRSKILRATCKYKYDRRSNKFISGEFTLTHNSFGEFILQQHYSADLGKILYIYLDLILMMRWSVVIFQIM